MHFKRAFMRSAKVSHPQGPRNQAEMRDIIRCYAMGWFDHAATVVESIGTVEDPRGRMVALAHLRELDACMEIIHSNNWWPDRSWKWWGKQ